MFTNEQGPFLFTVLLSMMAWTINQLTTELESSPLLEYHQSDFNHSEQLASMSVINISKSSLLTKLTIKLSKNDNGKFSCSTNKKLDIEYEQPTLYVDPPTKDSNGNDIAIPSKTECTTDAVKFRIYELQPGSSVTLKVPMLKDTPLNFHISSNVAIKAVNRNIETWLVKNKFEVLSVLFIAWILLIIIYLFYYSSRKVRSK